jgi:hypothetical protein
MEDASSACSSTMLLSNVWLLVLMACMVTPAADSVRTVLMAANCVSAQLTNSAQSVARVHTTQVRNTTNIHSIQSALRHVPLATTVKTSFTVVCPVTNLVLNVLSTPLTALPARMWLVLSITTSTEHPVFLLVRMVISAKSGTTLVCSVTRSVRSVLAQTNTPVLPVELTTELTTI